MGYPSALHTSGPSRVGRSPGGAGLRVVRFRGSSFYAKSFRLGHSLVAVSVPAWQCSAAYRRVASLGRLLSPFLIVVFLLFGPLIVARLIQLLF